MKLTKTILKRKHACQSQLDLFNKLFPAGVEITESICVLHASDFDWDWAAKNLLPASALADYERVRESAWADYERTIASARADYQRVSACAWADYASVWADYQRASASAFGRLAEGSP